MSTIVLETNLVRISGRPYKRDSLKIQPKDDIMIIQSDEGLVIAKKRYSEFTDGLGNTFDNIGQLTTFLEYVTFPDPDPVLEYAKFEIYTKYSHIVRYKGKSLRKFGQRVAISNTTKQTMFDLTGSDEVYVTDNSIDTMSSTQAENGQNIRIEGQVKNADGTLTFVEQIRAIDGNNKVTLNPTLHRCTRMENISGDLLTGLVSVYQNTDLTGGAPTDNTKVHCTIKAGEQKSRKTATSFSNNDYFVTTSCYASVNKKQADSVDFSIEERKQGEVFKEKFLWTEATTKASGVINLNPAVIFVPNSDTRIAGIAGTDGTSGTAWYAGQLAEVVARLS